MEKETVGETTHLISFVEESERREEEIIVVMRNLSTGDEVVIPVNPHFIAGLFPHV